MAVAFELYAGNGDKLLYNLDCACFSSRYTGVLFQFIVVRFSMGEGIAEFISRTIFNDCNFFVNNSIRVYKLSRNYLDVERNTFY